MPTWSRRSSVNASSSRRASGCPRTQTSPDVGVSIPAARFRSVLLPEPLRPTIAVNPPGPISSVSPSSARTRFAPEGNSFTTWSKRSAGMAIAHDYAAERAAPPGCGLAPRRGHDGEQGLELGRDEAEPGREQGDGPHALARE